MGFAICYNKHMLKGLLKVFLFSLSFFVCIFLLVFCSPSSIGPFGVLLFFVFCYLFFFFVFYFVIYIFREICRNKLKGFKNYLYASVLAFCPMIFFMLSFFNISFCYSVSIVLCFGFLGCLLIKKINNVNM